MSKAIWHLEKLVEPNVERSDIYSGYASGFANCKNDNAASANISIRRKIWANERPHG